jgi:hypothetical protein
MDAHCKSFCDSAVAIGVYNSGTSESVEWYHEGQSRAVDLGGLRVIIRFVGRKGRRGRIAITAPAGAAFESVEFGPGRSIQLDS